MDQEIQDYLFDLQGYLILENAISKPDLDENRGSMTIGLTLKIRGRTKPKTDGCHAGSEHRNAYYNIENGVNFQNIIEGGRRFSEVDRPSVMDRVDAEIRPRGQRAFYPREFPQRPWTRRFHSYPLWWTCPAELPDIPTGEHRRMDGRTD